MKKVVITVVGKDCVGIIAKVCTYLSDNGINVLDISQTIVRGYFNMMMFADIDGCSKNFPKISEELDEIGKKIGVVIRMQHEDIFDMMHRI